MQKLYASNPYLILLSLFSINNYNNRRSLTTHEFEIYRDRMLKKCHERNIEYYPDVDESFMEYYDYIELPNETFVYRLKPIYSKEDIIEHIHSVELLKVVCDPSLVVDLNDLSITEEQSLPEFKKVDEKYQLRKMHELLRLNQEITRKEQELGLIRKNSISLASEETVERIFEETPFISLEDLEKSYQSR